MLGGVMHSVGWWGRLFLCLEGEKEILPGYLFHGVGIHPVRVGVRRDRLQGPCARCARGLHR